MSRSLPQPWLRTTAVELLSANGKSFPNHRPRAVQVIRTNEQLEFIVINDKEHFVTVFLTAECLRDLREQQGIVRLTDLKNSVIKLENFHFSSTVQSGGNRDVSKFDDHHVSCPFALQCSKLVVMGGDDCDVMGNPVDLNKDKSIRTILNTMNLSTMTQRLAIKQFPQQRTLPNAGTSLSISLLMYLIPIYCSPQSSISPVIMMLFDNDSCRIPHSSVIDRLTIEPSFYPTLCAPLFLASLFLPPSSAHLSFLPLSLISHFSFILSPFSLFCFLTNMFLRINDINPNYVVFKSRLVQMENSCTRCYPRTRKHLTTIWTSLLNNWYVSLCLPYYAVTGFSFFWALPDVLFSGPHRCTLTRTRAN